MESLKVRLLEKLAQSLVDLQLKTEEISNGSVDSKDSSKEGSPGLATAAAHEVSCEKVAFFLSLSFGRWDVKIHIPPLPSVLPKEKKLTLWALNRIFYLCLIEASRYIYIYIFFLIFYFKVFFFV